MVQKWVDKDEQDTHLWVAMVAKRTPSTVVGSLARGRGVKVVAFKGFSRQTARLCRRVPGAIGFLTARLFKAMIVTRQGQKCKVVFAVAKLFVPSTLLVAATFTLGPGRAGNVDTALGAHEDVLIPSAP